MPENSSLGLSGFWGRLRKNAAGQLRPTRATMASASWHFMESGSGSAAPESNRAKLQPMRSASEIDKLASSDACTGVVMPRFEVDEKMYALEQLHSVRESQKWIWVALAGIAVFQATLGFRHALYSFDLMRSLGALWLYLNFLFTAFRYYVGDNRILDYYYRSLPHAIRSRHFWIYMKRLTTTLMLRESVTRVIPYMVLVMVGSVLHRPLIFAGLLVAYSFVCLVVCQLLSKKVTYEDGYTFEGDVVIPYDEFRIKWRNSNIGVLLSVGSMLVFVLWGPYEWSYTERLERLGSLQALLVYIYVGVALFLQSCFDINKTDRAYFPKFARTEKTKASYKD